MKGCPTVVGKRVVAGEHSEPLEGGGKKQWGPLEMGEIEQHEAVAKAEHSLGNLLLPPCLPWPRVPSDSSIAEPLIGAARHGEPKL